MIDPYAAAAIIAAFLLIWGILIPVCGASRRFRRAVSLRYAVLVVFLALSIGVVVDFRDVGDDARALVLTGTMILAGIYLVMRSAEKALAKGWIGRRRIELTAKKGDIEAGVVLDAPPEEKADKADKEAA